LNVIFLAWPGHGAPALISNVYLEGAYSEIYSDVSEDSDGLRRLFKLAEIHEKPTHLALLEEWLRSYRPQELFASAKEF
jgi:phosphoketolase